jgi:hypothetical protein
MPQIPGKLSIDTYTYLQTRHRALAIKLHWEPAAPYADPGTFQIDVSQFNNNWMTPLMAPYSSDVVGVITIGRYYSDTLDLDVPSTTGNNTNGQLAAGVTDPFDTTLPDATSMIVQRRTAIQGRSGRGRVYFPAMHESTNTDGVVSPVHQGLMEAIAAFMGADFVGVTATWHARHFSKKLNDLIVISQCRAMQNFGQQRRREVAAPNLPIF